MTEEDRMMREPYEQIANALEDLDTSLDEERAHGLKRKDVDHNDKLAWSRHRRKSDRLNAAMKQAVRSAVTAVLDAFGRELRERIEELDVIERERLHKERQRRLREEREAKA